MCIHIIIAAFAQTKGTISWEEIPSRTPALSIPVHQHTHERELLLFVGLKAEPKPHESRTVAEGGDLQRR